MGYTLCLTSGKNELPSQIRRPEKAMRAEGQNTLKQHGFAGVETPDTKSGEGPGRGVLPASGSIQQAGGGDAVRDTKSGGDGCLAEEGAVPFI